MVHIIIPLSCSSAEDHVVFVTLLNSYSMEELLYLSLHPLHFNWTLSQECPSPSVCSTYISFWRSLFFLCLPHNLFLLIRQHF